MVRPHEAVTEPGKRSPQTVTGLKVGRSADGTLWGVKRLRVYALYAIAPPLRLFQGTRELCGGVCWRLLLGALSCEIPGPGSKHSVVVVGETHQQ